jgi:hypothetical protein
MNHRYKLVLVGITLLIIWKLFLSSSTRQPNSPAVLENEVKIAYFCNPFHLERMQTIILNGCELFKTYHLATSMAPNLEVHIFNFFVFIEQ